MLESIIGLDMLIEKKLNFIDQNEEKLLQKLIQFLRIESISTDKNFSIPCKEAANWLVKQLMNIGFQATAHKTKGNPIVLASAGSGPPHLLFYGHYDVQPTDPLESWHTPPFEPEIKKGLNGSVICARGASDDKGQLMTFINACEAFIKTDGNLPCKISLVIEGEEETGSTSLKKFLETNKQQLNADHALVCDTGMWNAQTPAISTMLRGMLGEEVNIKAANKDLHSGLYGGTAVNPIRELARLITSLHDKNGRVTINNFYKGVYDLPKGIINQWSNLNFSSEKFLGNVGLNTSSGEQPYSLLEQIWCRPTCEINGIYGGYIANGFKTVIPSEANAKISFRLVGDQDPEEIRIEFREHMRKNLHRDCKIKFSAKDGSRAISVSQNSSVVKAAQKALSDEWGVKPVFAGCGGSIPVVSSFKETLGLDTLLVGFSLEDDQIHSPNEKYDIRSYLKGSKSWIRIIHEITG